MSWRAQNKQIQPLLDMRNSPESPAPSVTALRVLIADDNKDAALSLSLLLELHGHTVFTAFNGQQALDIGEKESLDAAVLDIGMPELDGYELAQRIRKCSWGRRVKLIAATGYGQPSDVKRAKEAGFDQHLLKPMAFEAIDQALRDSTSEE
jgi:CheY-like chemotaxis protein